MSRSSSMLVLYVFKLTKFSMSRSSFIYLPDAKRSYAFIFYNLSQSVLLKASHSINNLPLEITRTLQSAAGWTWISKMDCSSHCIVSSLSIRFHYTNQCYLLLTVFRDNIKSSFFSLSNSLSACVAWLVMLGWLDPGCTFIILVG